LPLRAERRRNHYPEDFVGDAHWRTDDPVVLSPEIFVEPAAS
jgi:hypothetical protein